MGEKVIYVVSDCKKKTKKRSISLFRASAQVRPPHREKQLADGWMNYTIYIGIKCKICGLYFWEPFCYFSVKSGEKHPQRASQPLLCVVFYWTLSFRRVSIESGQFVFYNWGGFEWGLELRGSLAELIHAAVKLELIVLRVLLPAVHIFGLLISTSWPRVPGFRRYECVWDDMRKQMCLSEQSSARMWELSFPISASFLRL